ncbi:putative transcriptional regulatory protein TTE1135 [Mytilus galloprovincialis]|uniref:putative transcriptional regulatory protein TTE1135 n=1 Tax=Mytilus galloprovincialis TaxID=29158 RepID=UPI003F7BD131
MNCKQLFSMRAAIRIQDVLTKIQLKNNISILSSTCDHSGTLMRQKHMCCYMTDSRFRITFSDKTKVSKSGLVLNLSDIFYQQNRQKGHSHWQNIKHTKGEQDAIRGKDTQMLTLRIKNALKDNASTDPKVNNELGRCIDSAKQKNIAMDTILRIIKNTASKNESSREEIIECSGAGGLKFIIQAFTDLPKRTRPDIQAKLKKFGATIDKQGTATRSFERKGFVDVELGEGDSRNHDDHIELAIEAEADDVSMETNEEGIDILQFECNYLVVNQVRKYLQSKGLNIVYAESVFIPIQTSVVQMNTDNMEKLYKLIDKVKEVEGVEEVFFNAEPES